MSNASLVEVPSGDAVLHAKLDIVDKNSPVVLFIPGISGGALTSRFDYLAEEFNRAGFNFVRFDFRGYAKGKSIDNSTVQEELEDIHTVLSFLESQKINLDHFGIVAKSFGGVKAFLLQDSRLSVLGLLAPAVYFSNIPTMDQLKNKPYKDITHLNDLQLDEKTLKTWSVPTLIVHGDQDKTVPLENSQKIVRSMTSKKDLKVIAGGGHSLDETEDQKKIVRNMLIDFFKNELA